MNTRDWGPFGLDPRRLDALLALAVLTELELECWLSNQVGDEHRAVTAVAAVFFVAPVIVRRATPQAALIACLSVGVVQTLLGGQLLSAVTGDVVPVVAIAYGVGAWLPLRRGIVTTGTGVVLLLVAEFVPGDGGPPNGLGATAAAIGSSVFLIVPAWFVGRLAREYARRAEGFRALAAQAAVDQEEGEATAIADERVRIGRELQHIIATNVDVMVLHAEDARTMLRTDPDAARDSIRTIESTGREALADLRRLLGMLRSGDDPRALSPQPGLAELVRLIELVGRSGLVCDVTTQGSAIDLTPGCDLVAYRVIEATLATATDHDVDRARITITYEPHLLEVDIRGDAPIPDLVEQLQAAIERVALYDGTLRAVADDGRGGFVVTVRLPLYALAPA